MTTVAYRDGVIAGDGRMTDSDGRILAKAYKKITATEKHLAGFSGQPDTGAKFLQWVKEGCDEASRLTGDLDAFVVDRNGIVTAYDKGMAPIKIGKIPFYAVGSGAAYAIGAMEMGASAEEAVRIAAKHDTSTGGRVRKQTFL